MLEGQALSLRDKEVGIDDAGRAKGTPDEEDLWTQVAFVLADHVGCDDGDDAVPEPVRCGGKGDTARSDWQREHLADDDPRGRTPGRGEEEDVDADEGDLSRDSLGVAPVGGASNGHDELANRHANSTPDENCSPTILLDDIEGQWSRAYVDQGGD